jgi:hypothetical protein
VLVWWKNATLSLDGSPRIADDVAMIRQRTQKTSNSLRATTEDSKAIAALATQYGVTKIKLVHAMLKVWKAQTPDKRAAVLLGMRELDPSID